MKQKRPRSLLRGLDMTDSIQRSDLPRNQRMATISYEAPAVAEVEVDARPWWRQLTGYHWLVFAVASAAWFFDCLDQRLFSLARIPALASLMHSTRQNVDVQAFGKVVTAFFLVGWGVG